MESTSPYSPPQTDLLTDQESFGPIKIMTSKGRIGRLRYIAYTMGISLLIYLGMMAVTAGLAMVGQDFVSLLVMPVMALGFGGMMLVNILLTIQRCHDFNTAGWLSLVLVLPLVPLIFWFIPGTQGENRFGPPPPPNQGAGVAVIVILLLLMVFSVLAAIAIPAYQTYMERAAVGM